MRVTARQYQYPQMFVEKCEYEVITCKKSDVVRLSKTVVRKVREV